MTSAALRHPLARAAERLGFQLDVVLGLETVGAEVDARVATLLTEPDPAAFLTERDAIVRRVGATTAGLNVELYAGWWATLVTTLNARTQVLYPDWAARESFLLNRYPYTIGRG